MAESKQRVGVITIHHVPNYGAFLQCWSLVQAIRDLGHQVEVIDYQPPQAHAFYRDLNAKSRFPLFRRFSTWRFERYNCRHLPLSPRCRKHEDLAQLEGRYTSVVCGSDQIWNIKSFRGFDPAYFLSFVNNSSTRRVAYAPSCSDLDSFVPHDDAVRQLLSRFDCLSARDQRTLELVQGLGVAAIQRVVDPTLLGNFESLASQHRYTEPYILTYGGLKPWVMPQLRQIADRLACKIYSVGGKNVAADRSFAFALPDQWLALFRDSRAVVTSAFHGVMFALKYERPFVAVPSAGKAAKISDALQAYGLSDRLVADGVGSSPALTADELFATYNAAPLVTPWVERSRQYLMKSLHG